MENDIEADYSHLSCKVTAAILRARLGVEHRRLAQDRTWRRSCGLRPVGCVLWDVCGCLGGVSGYHVVYPFSKKPKKAPCGHSCLEPYKYGP